MIRFSVALVYAAIVAVCLSFAALARRYRALPIGSRVLTALIAAWQVATLMIIVFAGLADASASVVLLELAAVVAGAGSAVSNAWLLAGISEASELEASRARARALEEQVALQQAHLTQTEQALAVARQDRMRYATEFTRIADALASGDAVAAREGLARTEEALPRFGGRLCAHPVVDALLKAKMAQAKERGAQLVVHAEVPADIGITDAELCAVISNLVDNALAAAVQAGAEEVAGREQTASQGGARHEADAPARTVPTVTVRMRTTQGYLVLAVENPCTPEQTAAIDRLKPRRMPPRLRHAYRDGMDIGEASLLPEHGWGLTIVRDLAERREGTLTLKQRDGMLRVDVILKLD